MTSEHDQVARRTANAIARHHPLDRDELHAIALTSAWEAQTKLLPAHVAAIVTRRRIIDAMRDRYGDARPARHHPNQHVHSPLTDTHICHDPTPDRTAELAELYAGDDPRLRSMLWHLAAGWTKAATARRHGIHPSRLSQLLAQIRRTHQEPQ
jgi:hypothetical protein